MFLANSTVGWRRLNCFSIYLTEALEETAVILSLLTLKFLEIAVILSLLTLKFFLRSLNTGPIIFQCTH
jgi:hypothetical protein